MEALIKQRFPNIKNRTTDLWQIILCITALVLPQFSLIADDHQISRDYCQAKLATGMPPCHLQPCPCGPGEETLRQFEHAAGSAPICACRSPLVLRYQTRQRAVAACDSYRREQRQSCFISRGECPRGFEVLAEFSDHTGNRFTACKDGRHQQPRYPSQGLHGLSYSQLLQQYERLVTSLDSQRVGEPQTLPQSTIESLTPYFPATSLSSLSLIHTKALREGCFNDCERIFCAAEVPMESWLDSKQPLVTRKLLHLIVHVENCNRAGGRNRFVDRWFRHLADDVMQQMQAGEPIAAGRLHYSMYMESHADNRAENLCRQLPACRME